MTGEVIKSFLVGLGFGVDEASLSKFNKSIASASLRVAALYATIKTASAGIVYGISQISEGFEKMGYEYRIIAPAINKALFLRRELLKAYAAAGINITKVIQASVKLNMSLAKTRFAFEAIYRSVGSRFFGLITKQSDLFRQKIYQNMPKIQHALESFVKFVFKALDATTRLGSRLWSILTRIYDFFVALDHKTQGWSTIILGVVAAWEALNLSFIATPLGMIITGLVAILALFDDFKTFQEGGESLFNWSSFIPVIDAVTEALQSLWSVLKSISDVIADVIFAFYKLFHGDTSGFASSLIEAGNHLLEVFSNLWGVIKGVGSSVFELGKWGAGLFGNSNVAANIGNNPNAFVPTLTHPLGSGIQNSQSNQNVHQQTQISVQGSPNADAQAIGQAVAGQQGRVNFDMVRNLKGATR